MTKKLNDADRAQWIDNDQDLYSWKRGSGLSMREFIRQNRFGLDEYINRVLNRPPTQKSWRDYADA